MLRSRVIALPVLLAGLSNSVFAQSYDLSWHTFDAGGAMHSTDGLPGGFELSGTIGQPDAGATMTGGGYELLGGFWAAAPDVCACLGDLNDDGQRDGQDIQSFVDCLITGGACGCADLDAANGVTIDDVSLFVADLLAGATCP